MNQQKTDGDDQVVAGCNVNSRFNFTVGGFSIAAAVLAAYLIWWK